MRLVLLVTLCATAIFGFQASYDYPYTYCGAPSTVSQTQTDYTLELVQVITRHGDRTTLNRLPTDNTVWYCNFSTYLAPTEEDSTSTSLNRIYRKNYLKNRNAVPGTCYMGELTQVGFDQHIALGQNLRQLYVDNLGYLDPELNLDQLWLRSTDVPRTLASAQGGLLGMFPANGTNPIPVVDQFTIESSRENMNPNTDLCPKLSSYLDKVYDSSEYVAYMKTTEKFAAQLSSILGISVTTDTDYSGLLDAFQVLTCHNLPYPAGITEDMVQQVFEIANTQWNFQLNSTEVVRLGIGSFTAELMAAIQSKISGEAMPKYMLYSGHDTTIGPLLSSLSSYDGRWPPYASHMEMELWSNAGEYYVMIKYQGVEITPPGCPAAMCPVDVLTKVVAPFIPSDFAAECAN